MYCMKCGQEIEDGQVFCPACLEKMAQYPVKPGTAVQLPQRTWEEAARRPAPRKRTPSPAEQLARMRKAVRWMSVCMASLLLVLVFTVVALYQALSLESNAENQEIGRNYSTVNEEGAKSFT